LRDPEESLFREPELNDKACARSADPSKSGADAVEVGAEGLEGLCCEVVLAAKSVGLERTRRLLTILIVLCLLLVVLATQLGPLCEVILRRSVCHLPV
jgi:hypothetical protein